MNSPESPSGATGGNGRATMPRWAEERAAAQPAAPSANEVAVLEEVLRALRRVRHGSVVVNIQDGKAVQVDVTEKRRLS